MFTPRQSLWTGLALAVVAVALSWGLRSVLFPLIGTAPFLPFFPAVIACAILGGRAAGVAATALSAGVLVSTPGLLDHSGSVPAVVAAVSLFVGVGLLTVWLADHGRRGHAEAVAATDARLRLAAVVESSDDSIVSKGLDGVIRSWNAAAERLFGYAAGEIVGQPISRLVPSDLLAEQASVVERLRRGERVEPFETVRLAKGRVPVRVLVAISPLRGDNGAINGAVEIARDTGPRLRIEADLRRATQAAERTVAQLRAVIDSMSEGVVVADADGNLLEWNRPALLMHGYASLDEVRRALSSFADTIEISVGGRALPPEDWPMARVLRGERFSDVEARVRRLDRPLELIINYGGGPVLDTLGGIALGVLTMHDVTEERRAQQAQRENAERLSLALDAADLGDWVWDVATDVVTLSPAAAALYGETGDRPAGREAMRRFIHEDDRARARAAAEQSVRTRTDYDIEYRVRRGDRVIWVAARGRGQFDDDGNVVRMLGVVQDVTARKAAEQELRESREWLELAVAIAQTGTFRLNLRDRQLTLNDAGRTIYGFSPSDPLTFENVSGRFHPDDYATVRAAVAASVEPAGTRRFELEHRVVRGDGVVRWIRVRGRTLFEDAADGPTPTGVVGTFIDVTEQKEAEQRREHLLAAEQAARADAEHASRMKDEFLATLSHELRTPLNAIVGWAEILAMGPGDDFQQAVDVIRRNARGQAQIIDDLLDMSRIISGKVRLNVQRVDVAAMAATAIDTVRPTADAKGVRLDLDAVAVAPVSADPARLQQILWNLLTNAVKFTPAGGRVRMSVRPTDAHDGDAPGVSVRVNDTGEGIRPDFLPHVFDRFRQADASTTRRHGGLGLGLAIVRQLAEVHGGGVRAESEGVGRGATFVVTLPARGAVSTDAAAPPAADPTPAAAGPTLVGVRVLVVDDEPDARDLVRRLLEDRQAGVTTAGSAAEAWAVLAGDARPDVLVSDIGMPGEDGYTLIGRVRAAGLTLPAVALTAYAREQDRAKAIAAGFQDHLTKPLSATTLVAAVARAAGR